MPIQKATSIRHIANVWRLGKNGFEHCSGTITETIDGAKIEYDDKFVLPEKDYSPKCDVCLAQEQGYGCQSVLDNPGPYETEGGCMDCKHLCRQAPIHIGVRNYCKDHIHILNKKMGIGVGAPIPL